MPDITIDGTKIRDVTIDGQDVREITIDGVKVWPNMIEDFEDISHYSQAFRGTFTGSTSITSNAAIATSKGSTQGIRCFGFIEFYSLPGDHDPGLKRGREASFYFRPVSYDSNDQWHFILAPQPGRADPPNWCYRFEFHMGGGSRITKITNGSRTVLDTENTTNWSSKPYECRFTTTNSRLTMSVAGQTLTTTDTTYLSNEMGFGFRASTNGTADYDWFGYV